jgi:transcriptional repressor NrdR
MIDKKQLLDFILTYIKENSITIESIPSLMHKLQMDLLKTMCNEAEKIYVLKRTGSVQPFDIQKLKYSISNASDDIKQPLNSSDIHYVLNSIVEAFKDENLNIIESKKLRAMVINKLKDIGYIAVANNYEKYYKIK